MSLNSKNLGQDNHPKQSISIDVNVNAIETMLINGIDQISNYQKKILIFTVTKLFQTYRKKKINL